MKGGVSADRLFHGLIIFKLVCVTINIDKLNANSFSCKPHWKLMAYCSACCVVFLFIVDYSAVQLAIVLS